MNLLGSLVPTIAHDDSFDRRFLERRLPVFTQNIGQAIFCRRDVTCHTSFPGKLAAFQGEFRQVAKTDLADAGNDLSVDAGRVGDLGMALEIAPSGALVAAGAAYQLGTGFKTRAEP